MGSEASCINSMMRQFFQVQVLLLACFPSCSEDLVRKELCCRFNVTTSLPFWGERAEAHIMTKPGIVIGRRENVGGWRLEELNDGVFSHRIYSLISLRRCQ